MEVFEANLPVWGALILWGGIAGLAAVAGRAAVALVAGPILMVSLCINGYVALQMFALLLFVCYAAFAKSPPRTLMTATGVITISVIVFSWASTAGELGRLSDLRREYPLVSVSDRLAHERSRSQPSILETSDGWIKEDRYTALRRHQENADDASNWRSRARTHSLYVLHSRTYDHFVTSAGFGYIRMGPIRPEIVRLPKVETIELTCTRPDANHRDLDEPLAVPTPPRLEELHWQGAGSFLSTERLGFIQDVDHVAGFEPHAFTRAPLLTSDQKTGSVEEDWQVARLELVSLLKHVSPRVYESNFLPNMELLSSDDVPTRELDDFEARALPQLRTHQDVVIDTASEPGTIRMLGALRADRDCLQCHSVRRGELLGAFSYRLQPLR